MKRLILISALVLTATYGAAGQEKVWSLKECMEYAMEHNISIRRSALSVEQRQVELSTAKNSMLPGVAASGSQNFSFGRGLLEDNTYANTNTTNTSLSLGADMPLFQGLRIKNSITLGKINLQAATEDLEKAKDDIRTAVAAAYVQILYSEEIAEVAHRQVEIDSQQVVRLENMYLNGKASQAEVSAHKASLSQSRVTAVQADNDVAIAKLELSQLLEIESPEGLNVVKPEASSLELRLLDTPDEIYNCALDVKPQIQSEKLRLDAAQTNIAIAKADYYPSLRLSGGLGSNYYTTSIMPSKTFFEQLGNNFSQYVGLSLNIPIFSRFSVKNNVKTAKISFNNQRLQLEEAKKGLYKEIQRAYYNAVASASKYESSKDAAASASEAFSLMSGRYENGKANITEFNESKAQYLKAESDLAQARYRYLYEVQLLNFYKGGKLDF